MKTAIALLLVMTLCVLSFAQSPAPGTEEFKRAVSQSVDHAVALYPDSAVEGSILFKAIESERLRLADVTPTFFNDPDWPIMLASKVAARLGMRPSAPANPNTPSSPPATPAVEPRAITERELQIATYVPRPALGSAMQNEREKDARQWAAEEAAMAKIEQLDLYAVALQTNNKYDEISDGSGTWVLERGEAFPFLGFKGNAAAVRLGTAEFFVSRNMVAIVRLSEHPELAKHYQHILAAFRASLQAEARQQTLDENNAILRQMRDDTQQMIQQQWLRDFLRGR